MKVVGSMQEDRRYTDRGIIAKIKKHPEIFGRNIYRHIEVAKDPLLIVLQ